MDYEKLTKKELIAELKKLQNEAAVLPEPEEINQPDQLAQNREVKFRDLLDNINDVVYNVNEKGIITYISPSVFKLMGYKPEEMLGKSIFSIMDNKKEEAHREFAAIEKKSTFTEVYDIKSRSGEKIWIRHSAKALIENGVFKGVTGILTDITRLKSLELEMQNNIALYKSIISASPDAISITDLTGLLVYSSDINYKMFGYDTDIDFTGHSILEFLAEEERSKIPGMLEKVLRGERIKSVEVRGLRKDGSTFDVEVNTEIIHDADNKPYNILLIIRDISDRKEMEKRLRKSDENFRIMIERINDVVYEVSADGTLRYISPVVEKILGYKPEEVIGKSIFSYMFPDDIQEVKEALSFLGQRDISSQEYRYTSKRGEVIWFSSSTVPIIKNGVVQGGTGVLTNINSRKLAEIKLLQSEEKHRSLIESSDGTITMLDKKGYILYANKIAAASFNMKPEEIIGRYSGEFFPPEQTKQMHRDIKHIFKTKKGYTKELSLDMPDGKQWFRISMQPVKNESGEVYAIMNHLNNITERKLQEEQLRKSEHKYRTLFNESPDGYLILQNKKFVECNNSAIMMIGGSKKDILGKTIADLSPDYQPNGEKSGELSDSNIRTAIEHNQNTFEWVHKKKDGSLLFTLVTISLIEYEEQEAFLILWKDISDKKQAEEELVMFRTIAESANYATAINKPNGEFIFVNKAFANMMGYEINEMLGQKLNMCFSKQQQILVEPLLDTLMNTGELPSREIWLKRKDGSVFPSLLTAATIFNDAGKPVYLSATAIDISSLKESERILRRSEDALNYAQMIAKMGSWDFNVKNDQLTWSDNQYKLFNLEKGRIKATRELFYGSIHPEDKRIMIKALDELEKYRKPVNIDLRFIMNDGKVKWLQNYVVPSMEDGEFVGYKGVNIDITEKKLAEEQLNEYLEKLKGIILALPDYIFIIDKKGNFLEYYGDDVSLIDIPNTKMVGKNIKDIFDTEYTGLHLLKVKECLEKQSIVSYTYFIKVKGKIKYFEIRLVPSGPEKLVKLVRELTEEVEKDIQIKKMSLALEQSPVAVIITDPKGNIEYSNEAFLCMTGYSREEIAGRSTGLLNSGSMNKEFYTNLWDTILSANNWTGEIINKDRNGRLYWEEMSITPIQNENGKITNFLAIKQDITERKKTEEEINILNTSLELRVKERTEELAVMNDMLIEEVEERKSIEEALKQKTAELENFFSVTLDLLCIADMDGNFVKVNKSWENILGYSVKELENKAILDFVFQEDLEETREILRQLKNKYPIINYINRLKTTEKEFRYIEWHIVPADDYIYGAARDVTNRILFEEKLNIARRDAEDANRAKSEFLANMSHEIRTPMNAVLGYSELLGSTSMNQVQKEYVNSIKSSGKSLLTLINDILDLSKIEAGKMNLEYDYVNTHGFFNEFAAIFSFKVEEKKLNFEVDIASGTPQGIYIDEARLRQVVFNLIGNAIKFTDKGYIRLNIRPENPKTITYTELASEEVIDLIIEVEDSGVGISKEAQASIFDSFIQEREYKKYGGTGLGLTISKKLVTLMKGSLAVRSEKDHGSTFTVRIPDVVYLKEFSSHSTDQGMDLSLIKFEKCRILIVDDVFDNRKYLSDVFRDTAVEIIEAVNGELAYEKTKVSKPDLIITDIRMPVMNGFELLEKIKADEEIAHIPVIAYSASVLREQKEKIYKSKFSGLLIKPVRIAELYTQLMNHLPYHQIIPKTPDEEEDIEVLIMNVIDKEGMIRSLENEFMDVWQTFSVRQPIKEVRKFGEDMQRLAEEHACPILLAYAKEMVNAAHSFNIESILKLLGKYKGIIEAIKNFKQPE